MLLVLRSELQDFQSFKKYFLWKFLFYLYFPRAFYEYRHRFFNLAYLILVLSRVAKNKGWKWYTVLENSFHLTIWGNEDLNSYDIEISCKINTKCKLIHQTATYMCWTIQREQVSRKCGCFEISGTLVLLALLVTKQL